MITAIKLWFGSIENWLLLGAIILVFAAGWKLRDYQQAEADNKELAAVHEQLQSAIADRQKLEDAHNKESAELESKLADLRKQKQKVEILKVREYVRGENINCPVSADGVQLLREGAAAVNAARSSGKSGTKVR